MNRNKRDNPDVMSGPAWHNAVLARALWRCEVEDLDHLCTGRATVAHHMRLRSQGGLNTLDNGLACCQAGHDAIHHFVGAARIVGYIKEARA